MPDTNLVECADCWSNINFLMMILVKALLWGKKVNIPIGEEQQVYTFKTSHLDTFGLK